MTISNSAELHRRQQAFRSLLDAFAQPGTVHQVALEEPRRTRPIMIDGALEALVRLFVDQAVSFGVADSEPEEAEQYFASETHAKRATCREAEFVVVPARADAETARDAVLEACRGTLISPEKGATAFIGCAHILADSAGDSHEGEASAASAAGSELDDMSSKEPLHRVEVRGPGVRDVNRFAVDRVAWAEARAARKDEFPCGIEIVLVDAAGNFTAIPRSARLVVDGDAIVGRADARDGVSASFVDDSCGAASAVSSAAACGEVR